MSLEPKLVDYVGDRVRSGRYGSASEVIRAAIRLAKAVAADVTEAHLKLDNLNAATPEPSQGGAA